MKQIFLLFLSVIALIGCNKESTDSINSTPIKPKQVISEYESGDHKNIVDTTFIYYNGNKVDSILNLNSKKTCLYTTDAVIVKEYRKNDPIAWHYRKFVYDANKRVVKVEFYLNVNSNYQDWVGPKTDSYQLENDFYKYEYLSDGSVKEQYLYAQSEENKSDYSIYKYDVNGNIVTKISYRFTGDQYHITSIDSMEYDNKNHYFRNVEIPIYALLESKINNITRIKSTFYDYSWDYIKGFEYRDTIYSVTNQTYQYDSNGYPTIMNADGKSHYKSMIIKY